MSLRARVGRHTRLGGRHCQNWADDQQKVIDLLNRIPVAQGGAGGKLNGRIIAGICNDDLYRAILQFEDKYFPGQRSGFIDPDGAILKRMEELTKQPAPKPNLLDVLRRNLLDEKDVTGKWTAGDQVEFDPLITMAVKHIDFLKSKEFDNIPRAELWGRAHVVDMNLPGVPNVVSRFSLSRPDRWGTGGSGPWKFGYYDNSGRQVRPDLPEMSYGGPLPIRPRILIATEKLGALLLFQDGTCFRLRPMRIVELSDILAAVRRGQFASN